MTQNIFKILRIKLVLLLLLSLAIASSIILVGRGDETIGAQTRLECPDETAPVENSRVGASLNGAALIDGQPFFPLGMYHVSWQNDSATRSRHLRQIAAAGYNMIHASFNVTDAPETDPARIAQYREFLDEAQQLGVYVVTEFSARERLGFVRELKDHPAVFAWNTADDADNGQSTPAKLLGLHCGLKAADPDHLTYISGYNGDELAKYVNTAEAIGVQAYPVGDKRDRPFSWPHYMNSLAHEAAPSERLIIANGQAFIWSDLNAAEDARAPNFTEIRNMTYQSLVAGAKGIIFYTYYDTSWNFEDQPELWREVQTLVPELKELSPILLEGNVREIDTQAEDILVGVWEVEDETLAIAINTSPDQTREVAISLSQTTAKTMFQEEDSRAIEDGQLAVSLEPLEVQIYQLN